MTLLTKRNLLLLIPLVVAVLASLIAVHTKNYHELRLSGAEALRSVSILFALLAGSSIALLNTFVTGLREDAKKQIAEVREILDEIANSKERNGYEELESLIKNQIDPLRCLALKEWLEYDEANFIRQQMPDTELIALSKKDSVYFARYFLRLEDEFNELGVIFVRRIVAKHHFDTARWSLGFLVISMIMISTSYMVPNTELWNCLVFIIEATLVSAVITNAAFLFSFFVNEAQGGIAIYESNK
ncbi:hypothetical protein [Methylophilus sp. Q8]|uniref:hypothetical protein n=1 Tax=Methylophilus sp. Q8 TaxID=1506586 RepID=UPI0006461328|nr:hypothetical protein [Methylophilus sp. Q8]